jgi:integrase
VLQVSLQKRHGSDPPILAQSYLFRPISARLAHRVPEQLREVVAGSPWEGLHPHAFQHLVATRLDAAGLSAREIADYLGHERISMTQDVCMSQKATGANAAAALDAFGPQSAG